MMHALQRTQGVISVYLYLQEGKSEYRAVILNSKDQVCKDHLEETINNTAREVDAVSQK